MVARPIYPFKHFVKIHRQLHFIVLTNRETGKHKRNKKLSYCWQTARRVYRSVKVTKRFDMLVIYSNFVPKTNRFWDIRLVSIQRPWNAGYGSLKVIGIHTDRYATYDFLLMFHSNRGPISYRFRARCTRSPWNLVSALG